MRIFFCGIALTGFILTSGCGSRNVYEAPPLPEVEVMTPRVQDTTLYRSFPGRLEAVDSIYVHARVSGLLKSVGFQDGEEVEAGQVLFTIESDLYQADVDKAQAQLQQAQASLTLAESSLSRKQRAFASQSISELDVLSAEADVALAQGAVLGAEAALAYAQFNLDYTRVTAPIAGRVDRSLVSVGNLVGGAQTALLTTLVSVDPLDCYFSIDERALLWVRQWEAARDASSAAPPSSVQLELVDGTLFAHEGIIDFQEPRIDPQTGTLLVRARFPNPEHLLVPGMFGRVRIPFMHPEAMLVPERAVLRDMRGSYVLVVDENGLVDSRYIETGALAESYRVVAKGLQGHESVIVRGVQRARPGASVHAVPYTPATGE